MKNIHPIYNYFFASHLLYNQKGKNILLFATRRGGSTILSQALSMVSTIREIDQPFDLFKSASKEDLVKIKNLPYKELSQFIELTNSEKKKIDKYFKSITRGKKFNIAPYYTLKNKTLLKIVNANTIADHLISINNDKAVFLFRHPCSQALSIIKNKWGFTSKPYLESKWIKNHFSNEIIKELKNISQKGTMIQKGVVNWGFENLHLLKFSNSVHEKVFYEELITAPELILKRLYSFCDLTYFDEVASILQTPSRSSNFSDVKSVDAINDSNKKFIISKWEDQLSQEEKCSVQIVLDLFGINEYSAFETLPLNRESNNNLL